jgi:DNA-binding transcriptional MerR regulator/effector-binding domain-containing protein
MFRIGEFAQIAQVSGRQLRFYDQLGLLEPAHIDPQTGYRYYSIRQLPRLNSILALKELGLSLEQIAPLLKNAISPTELRAMLTMKQAQLAQSLREEESRLRYIESRIAQIDLQGGIGDYDVVVKQVPVTPFLSLRCACENMDEAVRMVRTVAEDGTRLIRPALRDKLMVVVRNDYDDEKLDLEIGFSLTRAPNANIRVAGNLVLTASELPAVDTMATIVRPGTNAESHSAFGTIGMWIEANGFEVAGPCREVFLEPVIGPPGFEAALVEIQFPVREAA